MRFRICIASLVFVMFTYGCGSFVTSDKWNHFAFSASVSSVATVMTSEPVESMAFTVGLGLTKEIIDSLLGSGFQITDLVADVVGAMTGSVAAAGIYMEEFP